MENGRPNVRLLKREAPESFQRLWSTINDDLKSEVEASSRVVNSERLKNQKMTMHSPNENFEKLSGANGTI